MRKMFHIQFKKNNGNLHVRPEGDFDGASAWELLNFLHDHYSGQGSVYIDTGRLRRVHSFGCSTFKCRLNMKRLPVDRFFFTGEKGFEIAPEGSKVIAAPHTHQNLVNAGRNENLKRGIKCDTTANKFKTILKLGL